MNMNSYKEIGGFFQLETYPGEELFQNALRLNNGRSCLRYIIKAFDIKEIYVPFYTCSVVWQSIQKENCKIKFYRIDKNFMPLIEFKENDFILYNNYFGINGNNIDKLSKKYKNIIIDNAQAFYMKKTGIAAFNSARKFFGVPDGAYLLTDKEISEKPEKDKTSFTRFLHLIKRVDFNASEAYSDFKVNEEKLENEPLKLMSDLTHKILSGIDYNFVKQKRLENFMFLNRHLNNFNELKIDLSCDDVPMVYPLLTKDKSLRKKLTDNKIYTARYWDKKDENSTETYFTENLIPLPIDQRYNKEDMIRIIEVINGV